LVPLPAASDENEGSLDADFYFFFFDEFELEPYSVTEFF